MSAPKSSAAKKLSPNKNKAPESLPDRQAGWLNRIDYLPLVQKTAQIFWTHKKRLIGIAILLLLTGGQAVTFNSSFNSNFSGGGSSSSQNSSSENPDWQKTLDSIENQENFKMQARQWLENKPKFYSGVALAALGALFFILILLTLFFLNCYFHLLLVSTVKQLETGKPKSKAVIKREIRGRWKKLALMRVIFGLVYLGSLALFMFPALFFVFQKSWPLAITMGGFALIAIFIVFMMISYVFRYSFYYLATCNLSIRAAVDSGYEVFAKFWKESLLTSLVNFGVGILAAIAIITVMFLSLIALALIAGLVWLIIFLVAGLAHAAGIAIGVGIVVVLIPLIVIGIILAASWQALVVIFWYLIFNQIAGCKIPETEKEPALAKNKKPAPKPVIQKEEE